MATTLASVVLTRTPCESCSGGNSNGLPPPAPGMAPGRSLRVVAAAVEEDGDDVLGSSAAACVVVDVGFPSSSIELVVVLCSEVELELEIGLEESGTLIVDVGAGFGVMRVVSTVCDVDVSSGRTVGGGLGRIVVG